MAETGNGKSETKLKVGDVDVSITVEKKTPQPPKKSSGCNLLFLVLPLAIMAAAVWASSLGDSVPKEKQTETPEFVIQPAAISTECEPGIKAGGWVKVVANVRVRSSPGYRGKDDTIHFCKSGDRLLVLRGPTEKDELCWWHVRGEFSGKTVEGWIADRARGGIRLLKPLE